MHYTIQLYTYMNECVDTYKVDNLELDYQSCIYDKAMRVRVEYSDNPAETEVYCVNLLDLWRYRYMNGRRKFGTV